MAGGVEDRGGCHGVVGEWFPAAARRYLTTSDRLAGRERLGADNLGKLAPILVGRSGASGATGNASRHLGGFKVCCADNAESKEYAALKAFAELRFCGGGHGVFGEWFPAAARRQPNDKQRERGGKG